MTKLTSCSGHGARRLWPAATKSVLSACLLLVTLVCFASPASAAPSFEVSFKGDYSETQIIYTSGLTAGQFRLRFGDGGPGVAETVDLPYNATADQVQAALNALINISGGGGSVSVFKSGNYRVRFDGGPLMGTAVPTLVPVEGSTPLVSRDPNKLFVDTVEPAGVAHGDTRVDYNLSAKNSATAVAGNPQVGSVLGCAGMTPLKSWTPGLAATRPSRFEFEWLRNGETIAGQTGSSYVTTEADAGAQIQCLVYAYSPNGTARSVLASLTPATPAAMVVDPQPSPAPPAPATQTGAATRPTVAGTGTVVGTSTRTCTAPANWTAGTAFEYQWLRNGTPISGSTATVHTLQAGDIGTVLQCRVTGSSGSGAAPGGGKLVGISTPMAIGSVTAMPTLLVSINPEIVIDATAPVIEFELPAGEQSFVHRIDMQNLDDETGNFADLYWTCTAHPPLGGQPAKGVCVNPGVILPQGATPLFRLSIGLGADAPDVSTVSATVSGIGVTPAVVQDQLAFGSGSPFGFAPGSLMTSLLDFGYRLHDEYIKAGGHPAAATARIRFNSYARLTSALVNSPYTQRNPVEDVKTLRIEPPPGLVGNPLAVEVLCDDPVRLITLDDTCPDASIVGQAGYAGYGLGGTAGHGWGLKPFYALEPERGEIAQFAFAESTARGIYVVNARLSPEDNYAVVLESAPITQGVPLLGIRGAICSYGGTRDNPENNALFSGCKEPGDAGAFDKPFLTAPTRCGVAVQTRMTSDSWDNPGVFVTDMTAEPEITGCAQVPFTPTVGLSPTSQTADSPSGLDVSIDVPSDGFEDPEGTSQSHLKKTVVKLPEGMSVNPSAATGLEGCTDEQLGLKTDSEPTCPDGSKIATALVTSPALEETLTGVMVLRTPKSTDPESGEMLRMALIVRNDERGILVKLPGSATADPQTGKLVATFDDNPELPIKHVEVKLRGGDKGVLAMPQDCGEVSTETALTPWSNPTARVVTDHPSQVDQRCNGGFSPQLAAGNSDNKARGQGGTYSFKFSREDGEQWLRGLTAKLPKGLLASVKDVPLCANGLADAGNCPASSKIGVVDAKAGSGDPFVLEEKGEVFLTEGYKGGEYGLAVKIRPVAGPFRGEHELSPIIVRQAIHVDRITAEVTAISDPFPLIHHGIPLRAREVHVLVNRSGFMVNPSDCTQKQSSAQLVSDEGTTAGFTDPFQVTGCPNLPFKPTLALSLTGRKQVTTGKHPGVKAVVTQQGTSEAGIEQAVVRLPKSLALDPSNAQALCEFEDGTKPDLENRCPAGSIVGRARAKTPLLKNDLVGNVYFVKNVRKDPVTGNEIRTLPMIVVALRGEIAINLEGESSTTPGGKLVNTFASVPDAPISQFNLNIKGGKTGIIAVTRTRKARINLCAGRHVAEADMDGHNGRRHDTDVRMKTPCTKRQVKKAKRVARER